ncbi:MULTISPECIES: Rv1733c family protein [unclassified Streptomyces]|uniref:Rv1733c family protein n=1 Tax=unclassified Streptomyces TaxID=2593676 RepID=UPI004042595F
MNTKKRLWRWRHNALRRREDVVEAWIVLAVWVIVVIGGAVAGVMTFRAAAEEFAQQRAHRHAVRAVVLADAPKTDGADWPADGLVRAAVRWNAPDGTWRTGHTLVDSGRQAGTRVVVWQDDHGDLTASKPTGQAEGNVEAGLFGAAAALAVAAPVYGAGALGRVWLDRRRMTRWEHDWAVADSGWGRRPL